MAMRGNNARINSSSRGRTIPGQREPRWSPGARAKICSSKKDSSGEESRFYSVRKADPDRVPSTSSLSRVILSSGQRKRTARFLIILKTLLRDVPRHEPNLLLTISSPFRYPSRLGPRILSRRRKALENPSGKRGRDDKGFLMEDRAAPGGGLIRPTSREGGSRASFCSLSFPLTSISWRLLRAVAGASVAGFRP